MDDERAFYERSNEERIALTERAISLGGAVREHWTALTQTEADGWSARAAMAAAWIADERASSISAAGL